LITAAMSDTHQQTQQGEEQTGFEAYEEPAVYETNIGDTLRYRNGYSVGEGLNREASGQNIPKRDDDRIVGLRRKVHAVNGDTFDVVPVFLIRGGSTFDLF